MDKRVIRTKEKIKTAYMLLATEGDAGKITVSDITQRAGINRSTFYLHYVDVPAVAEAIDRYYAHEISLYIEKVEIDDIYSTIYEVFSGITAALEKRIVSKNYIIYSSVAADIIAKLKQSVCERTVKVLTEAFPHLSEDELKYPITYAAAGIVDCYVRWVRDGESGTPLNEVIREISTITEYIVEIVTKTERA